MDSPKKARAGENEPDNKMRKNENVYVNCR